MTTYPEDRRYESFEQRAAYDDRYVVRAKRERTTETCYCGKTVVAVNGESTRAVCPRDCERERTIRRSRQIESGVWDGS